MALLGDGAVTAPVSIGGADRAACLASLTLRSRSRRFKPRSPAVAACTSSVDGRASFDIEAKDLFVEVRGDTGLLVPVLKNCSIRIPQGQLWMLLGPNGCGKSTLLKCLAGLMRPSRGQMRVAQPKSFVFQNPDHQVPLVDSQFFTSRCFHQVVMPTAEADVAFGLGRLQLTQEEVRDRVWRSLKAVGMENYLQRPIQTLSGGQKQRVAIAGALAETSRVLLLDELTTFLDETDQVGVLEAVRRVVAGPPSVTSLWVTHRLEELNYADGAAYMENGRVVLSGSVADVVDYINLKKAEL
ncbi:ABC transporter I family member 10 isoform X1 [Selaginella moellendorffii]|uniref:ABC transporter I family member 10 isoform X1 n=1 Tax=Selaginella moellendorffii TaxID=88036 RepID=UPI000D1C31F5|nr:ABC transporter I family member 10 isoform X1 [Selaginella moellendorffii]XP_024533582.1 ABC transporter I family member 10 isoform X1 [Selaginella moellendorffii]|eukprot:XP_024533581.1 ABC transporter I family member 10 isoform X1 [Selaginella moellendorffii]